VKRPAFIFAFLLVTAAAFAQAPWDTVTNRPPAQWYPYPVSTSLWKQPIPAACHGSSMPSYCIINPSTYGLSGSAVHMVSAALTAAGTVDLTHPAFSGAAASAMFGFSSQGASGDHPWQVGQNDNAIPISYSVPGDPFYHIAPVSGTCAYDSIAGGGGFDINIAVQIPNQACWTGKNNTDNPGGGDGQIGGFDQAQGLLWEMSRGGLGAHTTACLPNAGGGTHQTPATALAITGDVVGSSCTAQQAGVDIDFGWAGGAQHYTWPSPLGGFTNTLGGGDGTLDQGATLALFPAHIEEAFVDVNLVVGQILRQTASAIGCVT
jgi:hypothetical protein